MFLSRQNLLEKENNLGVETMPDNPIWDSRAAFEVCKQMRGKFHQRN